MARKSSGGTLWWIIGGLILIAMVPKEIWVSLGVLGGFALIIYVLVKLLGGKNSPSSNPNSGSAQASLRREPTLAELTGGAPTRRPGVSPRASLPARSTTTPEPGHSSRAPSADPVDAFYSTELPSNAASSSYALPNAPEGFGDGRWVPPGENVRIAGVALPGGMIYIGGRLKAANGQTDPCLISGQLAVANVGNYRTRQMGYWPSYVEASPNERRAYLNWLSEGRSNPDCDIGYVFLFFYGLERRVVFESPNNDAAKRDRPAITAELRRLLNIYGEKSNSFRRYAGELLSWIELDGASNRLYEQPIPDLPQSYELPACLRLALGQTSVDRAPIPAPLALAWVRLQPGVSLRTAATRCPEEFEQLFIQRYAEVLGPGLVLPKNRTKLKFVYQAASAGLRSSTISLGFGDVPDITALTAPIKTLLEIANQCSDELGSYSRLVGKDASLRGSFDGLLQLPASLWPSDAQAKLQSLNTQMRDGRLTLTVLDLVSALGGTKQPLTRERVRSLARALEGAQIGMEPHVLMGARAPGEQDHIVLFAQPALDQNIGAGAEYQTAALTLQLASAVALADGDFNEREISHLRGEIENWAHLTPAERRRLHAHLQWLTAAPPTLAALKKKLEPLSPASRETIAAFMATLAQSDGFVSPDEVKFLEKVYKAIGVEPNRVFSDVHAAGAVGAGSTPAKRVEGQGFRLDADRIAALQEDTARVSTLLSKIFTEEAPSPIPSPLPETIDTVEASSPLGLDELHSALLRLMLSRPQWTRSELEDAAADLGLMLDGALEHINEAAFDTFDEPLCEGDDPVEVNTELLEKIEA